LALCKIIVEEDAVLIPKNRGENYSNGCLHLELFWGGVSHYAATPLIVALSQGHSDITRFCPWSPVTTGNNLDCAKQKNSKSCWDDWHRWHFWSAFRNFRSHLEESFHMSKPSWMMDPTH
jgi:hypothetical protein